MEPIAVGDAFVFDLWIDPDTGDDVSRCPWLEQVPGSDRAQCRRLADASVWCGVAAPAHRRAGPGLWELTGLRMGGERVYGADGSSMMPREEGQGHTDMLPAVHAKTSECSAAANARVVDLCCGMGGLSVAARELGMTVVAGVDVNPSALRTFSRNFPEAEAIEGSVRSGTVLEQCRALLVGRGIW